MSHIRIIAVVVDTQELTMYREDGTSIKIPQGDSRIAKLVQKAVPAIEEHHFVDITDKDLEVSNHYREVEKQMGTVARFFRVLKTKVKEVMDKFHEPVESMVVGDIPSKPDSQDTTEPAEQAMSESASKSLAAVAEIMQGAAHSNSAQFHEPDQPGKETTVIAVMEDNTIIPGIEQIEVQVKGVASKLGSPEGMAKFLQRVAATPRNHSVQDLLKFMEKGELPIADDGSVLVYKRLNSTSVEGVFADCHTNKVRQRVGSHVHMSESLVDHNRNQDCSNGLHIARRDYLSSFSGNVTVLCKLAPEDVIAVPHSDARKLRACGYHIIARLSDEDAGRVCSNQPMQDTVLLGNAIAGNHVGILETVEITEQRGGGIIIKVVDGAPEAPELRPEHEGQSLDAIPEAEAVESTVDARELGMKQAAKPVLNEPHLPVAEKALKEAKAKPVSKLEQLTAAWDKNHDQASAQALVDYKKSAKKSWLKLDFGPLEEAQILRTAGQPTASNELIQAPPAGMTVKSKPLGKAKKVLAPKEAKTEPVKAGSNAVQLAWADFQKVGSRKTAQAVYDAKRKAKKGWKALGLPEDAGDRISLYLN